MQRFTRKLKQWMKQLNMDIMEEKSGSPHFFFLYKVHMFFFLKCLLLSGSAQKKHRWTDTIFLDISRYKNPWADLEITPAIFLLWNKGSSEILQQCLEIAHSASSATLLSCHFFLSLTLHSCHFRPLFPCPRSPPSSPSHSFSLILNSALVDRQRG